MQTEEDQKITALASYALGYCVGVHARYKDQNVVDLSQFGGMGEIVQSVIEIGRQARELIIDDSATPEP